MKKFACFTLIACFVLSLFAFSTQELVQASTDVKGTIDANVTWTKTNSPYSLSSPTSVAQGVTVTVQPGVTILLNGFTLEVNGALTARGAADDLIIIDGGYVGRTIEFGSSEHTGSISFTSTSSDWNSHTRSGSIIEYAQLSSPVVSTNGVMLEFTHNIFSGEGLSISSGSPEIINNTFTDASIWVLDGSPLISNNIIKHGGVSGDGVFIYGGSPTISNNLLYMGFQAVFINGGNDVTLSQNIIANFTQGIVGSSSGKLIVEDNLIINNGYGIYSSKATIQYNTFAFNNVAIKFPSPISKIEYNNIESSNLQSIVLDSPDDVDAANNWWSTTDIAAINQSIYDVNDYYSLGKVNFTPFLTSPNARAPPVSEFNVDIPLTSSSPEPTPQPTISPTDLPNSSVAPSKNSNKTASPQGGEYLTTEQLNSIILVLSVVIVALIVAVAVLDRKKLR